MAPRLSAAARRIFGRSTSADADPARVMHGAYADAPDASAVVMQGAYPPHQADPTAPPQPISPLFTTSSKERPMGIYAFAGFAGSTGKTTSVVALAVRLAMNGVRVRVVDTDSQANASTWLGYEDTHGKTVADVFREDATIADVELPGRVTRGFDDHDRPVYGEIPNLTLVPARRSTLDKIMVELPGMTGGESHLRIALEDASPVDVTFVDCPGTQSTIVIAGVLATTADLKGSRPGASGVINCTRPGAKENEGLPVLEKELAKIRRAYGLEVPLSAIIPCAVPGAGLVYQEQMDDLRAAYGEIVTPGIRRAAVVDTAYANRTPIPLCGYDTKDVKEDYRKVQAYLEETLGLFPRRVVAA